MVAFGWEEDRGIIATVVVFVIVVDAMQSFSATTSWFTASDAPGGSEPTIIMQAEFSGGEEMVFGELSVSSTVETCSARVGDGFVDFEADGEIEFDGFRGDAFDGGEETVAVGSVAFGASGDAAKGDLVELVPFACGLEARVEEVRGIAEAGGGHEGGVLLAEERLHDVHGSTEEMRPA